MIKNKFSKIQNWNRISLLKKKEVKVLVKIILFNNRKQQ
jgi:hypothetical protein